MHPTSLPKLRGCKTKKRSDNYITLMHGTCKCKAEQILLNGLLPNSSLTNNRVVAEYYGEVTLDECTCGDYKVLTIDVKLSELSVDWPSFEAPLTIYRDNYASCDRDWEDGLDSGEIPSPSDKSDFQTSLDVTNSVKHTSSITAECIYDLD